MSEYKRVIASKIYDYLKLKNWTLKKSGKLVMVKCPTCNKELLTASIIPNVNQVHCIPCNKDFSIIDFVRIIESEYNDKSDEEIYDHLKDLLDIKVQTKNDEDSNEKLFKMYQVNKFSLTPLYGNSHDGGRPQYGKAPIEKEWQKQEHKDPTEWKAWIDKGLNIGIRTGEISNLTVVDIDSMPKELKDKVYKGIATQEEKLEAELVSQENLNETLNELNRPEKTTAYQITYGGIQLFYKYVPELRKTRINEISTDIETTGGQVVCAPSKVGNTNRHWVGETINKMPEELKKLLLSKMDKFSSKQSKSDSTKEIITPTNQEIVNFGLVPEGGGRSVYLTKMMGIIRQSHDEQTTTQLIKLLNNTHCKPPIPDIGLEATVLKSLGSYVNTDMCFLKKKVLDFLQIAERARTDEIELCIFQNRIKGEDKKRLSRVLVELIKEDKIHRKKNEYFLVKYAEWETSLINASKPLPFKVPYFDHLAHFRWGEHLLIGGQPGSGKCMRKGTKILMYDGSLKNIENIIIGEKIMGVDSKPRNVLNTCIGYGQMNKITPLNGEPFVVNSEHVLSLKNTTTKRVVNISLKKYMLKSKTFKRHHKLYKTSIDFVSKKLIIDPYFLGIWLGDGDSNRIVITTPDIEVISWLKQYTKKLNMKITKYFYRSKECPRWAINNGTRGGRIKNKISEELKRLNLLNNKHIPRIYKINSRQNRLKILAGLLDSDGYYHCGGYEIISKYKSLANDIVFLSRSLGFRVSISNKHVKKYPNNIYYRISICGDTTVIPVKILRKKAKVRLINKDPLVCGFTVQKLTKENYYGFVLDGDHLYLLDSFIVNHNTHVTMNIIKRLVVQGIKPKLFESEPNKNFIDIALRLGLKEEDFSYEVKKPFYEVRFDSDSVIIIDWINPVYKDADKIFRKLNDQLIKSNSFLISFMQLKKSYDKGREDGWFAPNLIDQYPSFATRFLLMDKQSDREHGHFIIDKVNKPKYPRVWDLPTKFYNDTCELKLIEEIEK